jgi:hypothetical protein
MCGMTKATEESYKSMQRMMKHCVETPNRGLLQPQLEFGVERLTKN